MPRRWRTAAWRSCSWWSEPVRGTEKIRGAPSPAHQQNTHARSGACVPACPVEAIFALDETPDKWKDYIEKNAAFYQK